MGMGSNVSHTLLLVFFVSVTILILSKDDAFAAIPVADAGPDKTYNEGETLRVEW